MENPRIAFRIVEARLRGDSLPPSMLLQCELETVPPVPFYIRMNGRGLDDPNAGHSPKLMIIERTDVQTFVAQVAQAFGVSVLAPFGTRGISIEWMTTLLENFSGHDVDGVPIHGDVRNWRADKWSLEGPEVELNCDYSLVDRRGVFSPVDDAGAIVRRLHGQRSARRHPRRSRDTIVVS